MALLLRRGDSILHATYIDRLDHSIILFAKKDLQGIGYLGQILHVLNPLMCFCFSSISASFAKLHTGERNL